MKKIFILFCAMSVAQAMCMDSSEAEKREESVIVSEDSQVVEGPQPQPQPQQNLIRALEEVNKEYQKIVDSDRINLNSEQIKKRSNYIKALIIEIENQEYHDGDALKDLFKRAKLKAAYLGQSTHDRPLYVVRWVAESESRERTFFKPICALTEKEKLGSDRSVYRLITIIQGMVDKKFCQEPEPGVNEFGVLTKLMSRLNIVENKKIKIEGMLFEHEKEVDLRAARTIKANSCEGNDEYDSEVGLSSITRTITMEPYSVKVNHPDYDDLKTGDHRTMFYKHKQESSCVIA